MDDQNIENRNIESWEQDLKNKLGDFREETDAKDLDLFMSRLENKDFFDTKAKIPSGVWAFVAGMAVSGLAIFLLYDDEPVIKAQEAAPIIESKPIEQIDRNTEKTIDLIDSNSTEVVEEIRDSVFVETATDVHSKEEIVEETPNTKQSIDEEQIKTKKSASKKVIQPISDAKQTKEKIKVVPSGRKRIIIMSADTTVVSDTTRVKHRVKE